MVEPPLLVVPRGPISTLDLRRIDAGNGQDGREPVGGVEAVRALVLEP